MNEKLKQFLTGIGVKDTDIAGLQDETSKIEVPELINNFKIHQRELMQNDPNIISQYKDEGYGKAVQSIQVALKRVLSVSNEEINALPDDLSAPARIERIAKIGIDRIQNSSKSTAEELQQENQNLKTEIIDLKEKKIPEIQAQADVKIKEFHIRNKVSELISKHELIVDRKVAELLVSDYINTGGFKAELKDEQIEILTKDGLRPQNSDRTKNLTVEEIITDVLTNAKVIRQSNAGNSGDNATQSQFQKTESGKYKYELPGMDKAKENERVMKERAGIK